MALTLELAVIVAGRGTAHLLTFLGLYWMVGGLSRLLRARHPSAARDSAGCGCRMAGVVGAVVVLLRDLLDGLVDEDLLVGLLGVSAVLTGLLRVLGGFATERQFGRRWTIGGIVLGSWRSCLAACCC